MGIVTPVNPIGAMEGSRFNGQGFDINRDFRRFDPRQARVVLLEGGPRVLGAYCHAIIIRTYGQEVAEELARTLGIGKAHAERMASGSRTRRGRSSRRRTRPTRASPSSTSARCPGV